MIEVSTAKERLSISFIQKCLQAVHWTAPQTIEEIQTAIENSLCFGLYHDGKQIGFARVISDFTVLAYVMDVVIDEEHRRKGYASLLIDAVLKEPRLAQVSIWRLATRDAQYLYEKFGFKSLAHPERMMEKIIRL